MLIADARLERNGIAVDGMNTGFTKPLETRNVSKGNSFGRG